MKKYNKYYLLSLLLAMAASFVSISCAEEDIVNDLKKGPKNGVSFAVTDVQDAPDADMAAPAASKEAFMVSNIDFNEGGTADMCLQETTVPGVNPMKRTPQTRAWLKSTIDGDFGVFACQNGSTYPNFFYNEKVNKNGQMYQPKSWSGSASTLKFYAIYPHVSNNRLQKIIFVSGRLPYIAFEASTDITNQIDFMTAETASISYRNMGGAAHVIPLKFTHALTAIRFGIGSNLSWNKTIKSIEFQGVLKSGQFNLATKTWSNQTGLQNFKLDNINKSTSGTLNTVIVKDGNTFLMVPQTLPTGAKIVITFTDGSSISANIGGKKWVPGTTKTYMITEKNSNWDYKIETTAPANIAYNQTQSTTPYTVKSYRRDPTTNTFQAVKWKAVAYQESVDDGLTWTAERSSRPIWLTNLTLTEGVGGTAAESGIAKVSTGKTDLLADYNKVLQQATPKGTASSYYDLSMYNYKGQPTARNTANSYLISAPGYYKIPLVYGNAIKNGNSNPHSYISQAPYGIADERNVLRNFKDHDNKDINHPWIIYSNGGANKPNGAKIVWTDQSGIVDPTSLSISPDGQFIQFRIPQDKIKNGNAVIAATKNGVVVWSWHLWFDHNDVLETIKCTNFQNVDYYFTKKNLGFAYSKWEKSSFNKARVARIKVEQNIGNGTKKFAYIDIKQTAGNIEKEMFSTFFQWGRKDAMPGIETVSDGSFSLDGANQRVEFNSIRYPEQFFVLSNLNEIMHEKYNLWSMDDVTTTYNDNPVVKTVYDPCPVGFHVPASNAFTFMTTTGENTVIESEINATGSWDQGRHFKNGINNPNNTIYLPCLGIRDQTSYGKIIHKGFETDYWTASADNEKFGHAVRFYIGSSTSPKSYGYYTMGFLVRPVAE